MSDHLIRQEIAVRAYGQGYLAGVGAITCGKQARHTVDSGTHEHWRRGYEDGRKDADAALERHRQEIKGHDVSKRR